MGFDSRGRMKRLLQRLEPGQSCWVVITPTATARKRSDFVYVQTLYSYEFRDQILTWTPLIRRGTLKRVLVWRLDSSLPRHIAARQVTPRLLKDGTQVTWRDAYSLNELAADRAVFERRRVIRAEMWGCARGGVLRFLQPPTPLDWDYGRSENILVIDVPHTEARMAWTFNLRHGHRWRYGRITKLDRRGDTVSHEQLSSRERGCALNAWEQRPKRLCEFTEKTIFQLMKAA